MTDAAAITGQLLRWGAFPALFFGAEAAQLKLLTGHYGPFFTGLVVLVPFTLAVFALEHLIPYSRKWNTPRSDVGLDFAYLVSNSFVQPVITVAAVSVYGSIAAWIAKSFGAPIWPIAWLLAAQLILALLIKEFFHYWLHRFSHARDSIVWRCHAIHHSSERLYWLNSMRLHVGNLFFDIVVGIGPLILLGAPAEILFLVGMTIVLIGELAHANIDFKLGPLNWIFSMAELHRLHHSKDVAAANHNYGAVLIIWDIVFGTFCIPAEPPHPDGIGLPDAGSLPSRFYGQLAHPFKNLL